MKKLKWLLLISLFLPILSFSQNSYPKQIQDSLVIITVNQLKKTNLVFLKSEYLLVENNELNRQNSLLKGLVVNLEQTDSIKNSQIRLFQSYVEKANNKIDEQNRIIKKEKKSKNIWMSLTFVSAVLFLLLK